MDLLKNPFYILTATPRDNRSRIIGLADERSLMLDSNECMNARSDLTNPRKRLSSEVAWLLGLSPKRSGELLALLQESPADIINADKLTPVARANLLAAGFSRLSNCTSDCVAKWILEIAWAFEKIDPKELKEIINNERIVSDFPEVIDLSMLESEIQERRLHYRHVFKSALNNLSASALVKAVTIAVKSATANGEEHGPILITDLVDAYEVEAQDFLEKEENNIKVLVDKLRTAVDAKYSDSALSPMVNQLINVVKNWDTVAQPIQVSAKSQGLEHDVSHRVAELVRDLALYMFNQHYKLDFSRQLTHMLQEVFAEVGEVAERTAEDAEALSGIAEQYAQIIADEEYKQEEWRKELTYEADIGVIFKDKLRISPEGIEWRGEHWNIDSITRIRWGGTRHSVNGIPTGTIYKIIFGNEHNYVSIESRNESIYTNFIERLWKSVGVRLLAEYLEGLQNGKKYRFGSAILDDSGMELERKRLFSSNERVFCRWSELNIWNESGTFSIGKKLDKKISATFSYQDEDNIHVLEAAIRMFWKKGGNRLSSLLGKQD